MTIIEPGKTIGILGGGQLGRMMALAARAMGYRIAVLDPNPDGPCAQVADVVIEAAYDDMEAAKKLVSVSDVVTYEFENVNLDVANYIEQKGCLPQGANLLRVTQHRAVEKETITSLGLPVAPYKYVNEAPDFTELAQTIGFPAVLKTCRGGYDGKGQRVVRTVDELKSAYDELKLAGELVLEAWVPFDKEISVIVARNERNDTKTFPVAENIHEANILHQSMVPARIGDDLRDKAEQLAIRLAEGLNLIGTLAVEMFVTTSGDIYINELAPRPHNSGHYTIEACETSQFEQHVRAICGWPLGHVGLYKPVVMGNLLGEHLPGVLNEISEMKDAKLHLYGKAEAKEKRKMGHITVLADDLNRAIDRVGQIQEKACAKIGS
jgi:5-(carboxyamino)imidazole ribonucleotide synthase